jgi:hypothetical protein
VSGVPWNDGAVSKLSDIIDAATNDSVSTANLLRMTKVLAARIETSPLGNWVDNELSGYPPDATVPAYRGPFPVQVLSEWSGPGGSIVRNLPLPSSALPEDLSGVGAFEATFREPVSELERLAEVNQALSAPWGANAVAILNGEMSQGNIKRPVPMHGLVSAHRQISPALIRSVLDNVRTRVLNLALELEKVAPHAGESGATIPNPSTVHNIFTTNIYGHGNTVAQASPGAVQIASANVNDVDSLLAAVSALGLVPEDVAELKEAIEGDAADSETPRGKPGSRVTNFLGKLATGALKTAAQDGFKEIAHTTGQLVLAQYGIT